MKRVTFYIDGFNFYYGLRTAKQVDRKWYKAYWIDLVKFFSRDISNNIKAHKGKVTMLEKNYNKFLVAQMPHSVTDGNSTYTMPDKWRET